MDRCDLLSTVIAWNTDKYGQNGPQSWADFWDTKKFPGTRSLSRGASETFEVALMADGVDPPNCIRWMSTVR